MSGKESVSELRALMLPLQHGSLVVPHIAIAEIISYREPEEAPEFADLDWVLGTVSWLGMKVPVISYEQLHGEPLENVTQKTKIAICNLLDSSAEYPAVGIVVQTIPRLLLLSTDQLESSEIEVDGSLAGVSTEAVYKDNRLWIPDLGWISQKFPE